jgi:hypothetical protein
MTVFGDGLPEFQHHCERLDLNGQAIREFMSGTACGGPNRETLHLQMQPWPLTNCFVLIVIIRDV